MRWNCPHCGVALAIADEKLGTGWSFSRCYHCGGFALVRRTDVNLIKIDQAPPGEEVLLPEASEKPLLSEEATRHLLKSKPVVKPARKNGIEIAQELSRQEKSSSASSGPPPFLRTSLLSRELPNPLPEVPDHTSRKKWLKYGIGISSFLAVISGIYLYEEGQELWKKARSAAQAQVQTKPEPVAVAPFDADIVQAPALASAPEPTKVETNHEVIDQLQLSAAAEATAPIENHEAQKIVNEPMTLKPKYKTSPLRAGPGLNFPVLGTVNPAFRYLVQDWKNEWFKVAIQTPEPGSIPAILAPKNPSKPLPKTAWIRNDLVQMVEGK